MNEFIDSTAMDSTMETNEAAVVEASGNSLFLPSTTQKFIDDYYEEARRLRKDDEIAGYTPTRQDLIQLVKFWYREYLSWKWQFFITGCTGSYEIWCQDEALWHINRVVKVIGVEVVNQAIEVVHDECKREWGNVRLWDIYENEEALEWNAADSGFREEGRTVPSTSLERLEEVEKKYPLDFIAMVLTADLEDKSRVVLLSSTNSELAAVLRATGKCEVVTDRATFGPMMRDFKAWGFTRATRVNGRWAFEIPDIYPGSWEWRILKAVIAQINKLLPADTGKNFNPWSFKPDLSRFTA